MDINEAIANVQSRISATSPGAVIRTKKRSNEEATIRVYAPASEEEAIRAATQAMTLQLLTEQDLDVQVLVYDIATSLPKEE